MLTHGYPFRKWWHLWVHRHETTEQREQRKTATRKRFREIYEAERNSWNELPDSLEMREHRISMDKLMDELLGPKQD
jgi:hypothetical protein